MQDFGAVLGSGSQSAQQPRGGYEYLIEPNKVGKGLAGVGFYKRDWMSAKWPKDPTIGNIEADGFNPETWKTQDPNPAFNQLDGAYPFWAASIMAKFTDQMIRGIVEESKLSNSDGPTYLADGITNRRDKAGGWGIQQA